MSVEEEQSQSGYEDGIGGPGAPTPLSALEVGLRCIVDGDAYLHYAGHQWSKRTRYQTLH
jgi:hypothetical protein